MTFKDWFVLRCGLNSPGLTQVEGPFESYKAAMEEAAKDARWGASIVFNAALFRRPAAPARPKRIIGGEV